MTRRKPRCAWPVSPHGVRPLAAPFPPLGPPGRVPQLPRYYGAVRIPDARPAGFVVLRRAVTRRAPVFVPRGPTPATRPGALRCGSPHATLFDERRLDFPGSWRTLLYLRPVLRPRQDRRTRPYGTPARPPQFGKRRLPRSLHFGAPSHGLGTRCLRFAGWVAPPPRKTRFPLSARLYGTGLATRRVRAKGFRECFLHTLSPFPGFAWRNQIGSQHCQPTAHGNV